ncbi:LysR family transcriptional regulator substrate-binding protein [Paenibacillus gyeongsangnamensis]|uniref:LysR family transcriptional regulator substrate-binding protein n=1 Tax=Paenibacillus gyeongsangnamensis TaxID=3388067 RepID=UPI0039082DB5
MQSPSCLRKTTESKRYRYTGKNSIFVATSDHPLARHAKIDFDEIKSTPIIMFPETHRCRQLIDRTCTSAGFDLQPLIETTTIDSLFGLVRSGAGATILSKTLIEMYKSDDLQVIPVENQ